jgi:hypothetical protein
MQFRQWLVTVSSVITVSALLAGTPFAEPPGRQGIATEEEFDDATPDPPLPPGISERVFIHLPRTYKPNHLGTCTVTNSDPATYGLAGWRLPDGGITWKLSSKTVPSSVGSTAHDAITAAFATWASADADKVFIYGGPTAVTRRGLDYTNAVLWGKVSGNAIAVTYVRYYTATGIVADVDLVFNNRLPWAVFTGTGDCMSSPDAYDVQNIAVHEIGHWVGLDDRYSSNEKDLTMYGYGAGRELKKRSLATGDWTGANTVAP